VADIFISYAREDRETAASLAEALTLRKWTVFWDRNIQTGKPFDIVIEQQIDAAKCVIVLWSRHSVPSTWVRSEAREGARREILHPVLIDDVTMPLEFRHLQAANLTDWKAGAAHEECDRLFADIELVVTGVRPTPPPPDPGPKRRRVGRLILGSLTAAALVGVLARVRPLVLGITGVALAGALVAVLFVPGVRQEQALEPRAPVTTAEPRSDAPTTKPEPSVNRAPAEVTAQAPPSPRDQVTNRPARKPEAGDPAPAKTEAAPVARAPEPSRTEADQPREKGGDPPKPAEESAAPAAPVPKPVPPAVPVPVADEASLRAAVEDYADAITSGRRDEVKRVFPQASDKELREIDSLKDTFGDKYRMNIIVLTARINGTRGEVRSTVFHNGVDDTGKPFQTRRDETLRFDWNGTTWVRVR
jgi:hypothetical protein